MNFGQKILPTSSVLEVASIVAELHHWTYFNKILYINLMDPQDGFKIQMTSLTKVIEVKKWKNLQLNQFFAEIFILMTSRRGLQMKVNIASSKLEEKTL